MAKKKITLKTVRALESGNTLWDTEIKGFGCRARKDGKFFVLKYSIHGRQRLYTLGQWTGEFTPDNAREEAEIVRGQIRQGYDPMAEREREKKLQLVKDAFGEFLNHIQAKYGRKTHYEYKRLYDKHIKEEIGQYKVDAVTKADISRIHYANRNAPYQANNVLKLLSSFFTWCNEHGHRTDGVNPCRYIKKYKEKSRERFLSEDELVRLSEALAKYERDHAYLKTTRKTPDDQDPEPNPVTPYVTAAIRLLILTGARRSEILTLKWENVDFQNKLIRLQESKTGQKTIYLSAPALQVLSEIPRMENNPYVICGKKEGTHLVNIKDPWNEIRKNAGLDDVRLHDLRHNYASMAVASGHHLKVIGSLLGHADTQTTERYAHLADDPLQAANEAISNRILNAMTGYKSDDTNIVNFQSN